jgi:2,4-dienoyl-CoA reductase-like NADH-dependent reductase (Old Yellow Enzyme family)
MRAQGGFGLTITCAAQVQPDGQGFRGQRGAFSDPNGEWLARLAQDIRAAELVSNIPLLHGGIRADASLVPQLADAADDPETGARKVANEGSNKRATDLSRRRCTPPQPASTAPKSPARVATCSRNFLLPETNRRPIASAAR